MTQDAAALIETVEYEVLCGGEFAASSTSLSDAQHYALVYAQDGPTEIVEVIRRPLRAAALPRQPLDGVTIHRHDLWIAGID